MIQGEEGKGERRRAKALVLGDLAPPGVTLCRGWLLGAVILLVAKEEGVGSSQRSTRRHGTSSNESIARRIDRGQLETPSNEA